MLLNRHLNFFNIAAAHCQQHGGLRTGSVADYNTWLHTANSTNLYLSCQTSEYHPVPFAAPLRLNSVATGKSFSDLADARATAIIAQAAGREIIVLWSGGIDSQVVLAAFLRAGQKVTVACTAQSILENPEFFNRHIHDKLQVVFYHTVDFSSTRAVLVGSAVADTLVGGSLIAHYLYAHYDQIRRPVVHNGTVDLEAIAQYWHFAGRTVNQKYAAIFADQVVQAARALAVDITTWWQFWNFADLVFRSSYDYWYHWPKYLTHHTSPAAIAGLDQWDVHFFMTDEFYSWALHDASLEDKIGTHRLEYKRAYKDYIYSYDKNSQYRDNKIKVSSTGSGLVPTLTDGYLGRDHAYALITVPDQLIAEFERANSVQI